MDSSSPGAPASSVLDHLCINTIRFLSIDAVQKANSGHPGMPMGAASMAYVLWTRFLRHNPSNPTWFNRDRFVLSAGHGSMLLYSLLFLTGYNLPLEQIKQFRQWRSTTPGHPERDPSCGIEVTTGPLGQGFANAVGMAVAEQHLAARFNRPHFGIIDHTTYAVVSDGDLMEGVAAEAASLAGHLKLGKLICLYDNNFISLAGATSLTFTEDRAKRFEAYGWHVQEVKEGNDVQALEQALLNARNESRRPSAIMVRTHLGHGSPHKQDTFEAHGAPLGAEEVKLTKQHLGWPLDPAFYVPEEAIQHFRRAVERGRQAEAEWNASFSAYQRAYPDLARELEQRMSGQLPKDWDAEVPTFPADPKGLATRSASGKVLNALAKNVPMLIGGSADLSPSTNTTLQSMGDFQNPQTPEGDRQGAVGDVWGYEGRNIHFGVREHAMGAMLNGIAAHGGFVPFGATFLVFSDYVRPAIRLAALMKQHVIYVFTHDSVGVGEDGPTHQPVEHLAALRTIPNVIVIRPCDANETVLAWRVAMEASHQPVALILTRQNVPTLDRGHYASAEGLRRGAYVLVDASNGKPDMILMASGSEVHLVLEAREKLSAEHVNARVVSIPSWELFDKQPKDYRDSVLLPWVKVRLAVEAGVSQGWHRYVGDHGGLIVLDRFGASAPGGVVMRELEFTVENVVRRARALLKK
jgi:transketolase